MSLLQTAVRMASTERANLARDVEALRDNQTWYGRPRSERTASEKRVREAMRDVRFPTVEHEAQTHRIMERALDIAERMDHAGMLPDAESIRRIGLLHAAMFEQARTDGYADLRKEARAETPVSSLIELLGAENATRAREAIGRMDPHEKTGMSTGELMTDAPIMRSLVVDMTINDREASRRTSAKGREDQQPTMIQRILRSGGRDV
jgi:hypothetical protein